MTIKAKNELEVVGRERLTPAIDVAKKFIAQSWSRPALAHIALKDNGEIQATDSHHVIILKNIHTYKETLLLNPKTLDLVKGYNYPDLNSLTTTEAKNEQATMKFTKEIAIRLIPIFKFVKQQKFERVKLTFKADQIEFNIPNLLMTTNELEMEFEKKEECEDVIITLNPSYALDILEAFVKFSSDEFISVVYQGQLRQLVFSNDEMLMVVLPLRTY